MFEELHEERELLHCAHATNGAFCPLQTLIIGERITADETAYAAESCMLTSARSSFWFRALLVQRRPRTRAGVLVCQTAAARTRRSQLQLTEAISCNFTCPTSVIGIVVYILFQSLHGGNLSQACAASYCAAGESFPNRSEPPTPEACADPLYHRAAPKSYKSQELCGRQCGPGLCCRQRPCTCR